MEKLKYYQLAFKNGKVKKLVSPSRAEVEELTADGWTLYGFDNENDIPAHPIIDNGTVREMTATEIEAAAIAAETARQEAKPLALKQAENEYLALFVGLPITLEAGDNSDTITQKLETSEMTELEAVKTGLKLLNAIREVDIKGGSWYDLPPLPHNLDN